MEFTLLRHVSRREVSLVCVLVPKGWRRSAPPQQPQAQLGAQELDGRALAATRWAGQQEHPPAPNDYTTSVVAVIGSKTRDSGTKPVSDLGHFFRRHAEVLRSPRRVLLPPFPHVTHFMLLFARPARPRSRSICRSRSFQRFSPALHFLEKSVQDSTIPRSRLGPRQPAKFSCPVGVSVENTTLERLGRDEDLASFFDHLCPPQLQSVVYRAD